MIMNEIDANQANQAKQIEEMKRKLLGMALSKEAFERLGRVRSVNPALAGHAEMYIINLCQAGKLKGLISDAQMKDVLRVLSEGKEINIKRK